MPNAVQVLFWDAFLWRLFGEAMVVASGEEMEAILVEFFAIWILAIVDLLSLDISTL